MTKKKILFTPLTSSSLAHTVRCLALADELKKQGWEIGFTSCHHKKRFIEKQGYKVIDTYIPFNLNDPEDQSESYMDTHFKAFVDWFRAEIDATKKFKPNIVVTSPGIFGAHIYYATGVPTIALLNGQYLYNSKCLMGVSMCAKRTRLLKPLLKPIFERKFITTYIAYINKAHKALNIRHMVVDRIDLYKDMHILIPGDYELEPLDKQYPNQRHVGPIFWNGFERLSTDITPAFLKDFKGNKKLVYLTFGGSVFDTETYQIIIHELLQAKIDFNIIVSIGPNIDRTKLPPDSNKLIIRKFVPGLLVNKYADITINTGAQGSIMQALMNGNPLVTFPVGIDQAFFANRTEEMELGVNVNKVNILKFTKRDSYRKVGEKVKDRIISATLRVLSNKKYKENAVAYQRRLNTRYMFPNDAVNNIINYINNLLN